MLSTASPWSHQTIYTPSRSSPLSSLPPNACQRAFGRPVMMERTGSNKDVPFSKRAVKPNPILQARDAIKERRRDMFLKKVQQDRDDRRWASRGEQILRLDFVATQKRWEAEKEKEAPNAEHDLDDYVAASWSTEQPKNDSQNAENAESAYIQVGEHPEEEADYMFEQEKRELDALISSMDESYENQDHSSPIFGSDEEDYDILFRENLNTQENDERTSGSQSCYDGDDAMDTSLG